MEVTFRVGSNYTTYASTVVQYRRLSPDFSGPDPRSSGSKNRVDVVMGVTPEEEGPDTKEVDTFPTSFVPDVPETP